MGWGSFWRGKAPPLAGTSRNIYWRRFSEDIVSAARHLFIYAIDGPTDIFWSIGWASDYRSSLCNFTDLLWQWENATWEATGSPPQTPIVRIFEKMYPKYLVHKPYWYDNFSAIISNIAKWQHNWEISNRNRNSDKEHNSVVQLLKYRHALGSTKRQKATEATRQGTYERRGKW